MGAYKLARFAYDKLQYLRTPPSWRDQLDIDALTLRSKPFSDKEELLSMCFNCSTMNPLLNTQGDKCINCHHPFVRDIITFDSLPLVEFVVPPGMSPAEVKRLVGSGTRGNNNQRGGNDGWNDGMSQGGADVLRMDDGPADQGGNEDPFNELLMSAQHATGETFEPVCVDARILSSM